MAKTSYDLLSIGDATIDVFLQIDEASVQCQLNRRDCLLCLRYGDKIPVEEVQQVPAAGNAANNAVGSARLGLRAALVTELGADDAGRGIVHQLHANGVATSFVRLERDHRTNYSVVLNFQGERTILVYHAPQTYHLPKLPSARMVYLTSMGKGWEKILPALRRYLRSSGAQLAFNPGTHQLRTKTTTLRALLKETSVLLVNREEAAHLLQRPAESAPQALLTGLQKLGPRTVVVTDGPRGSYTRADHAAYFMPIFPMPVVERTGAGDAFGTGFLGALLHGEQILTALRWGTANAGSVVQKIGPQAGLLRPPALRALLRRFAKARAERL